MSRGFHGLSALVLTAEKPRVLAAKTGRLR